MVSYPGSPGVYRGPLYTRSGRTWQMMDTPVCGGLAVVNGVGIWGRRWPDATPLRHNQPVLGANDTAAAPYCREAVVHRAVCHLPVPTALFVSGLRVVWQPFRRAAADTDSAIETRARSVGRSSPALLAIFNESRH